MSEETLVPVGTAHERWRRRTEGRSSAEGGWYRELLEAAAEHDRGDAPVYLSGELAALAPPDTRRAVHLLALCVLEFGSRGSTRWTGDEATLRRMLLGLAPSEAGRRAVERAVQLMADPSSAHPVLGPLDDPNAPLLVGPGILEPARSRWMEDRLASLIAARCQPHTPSPASLQTVQTSLDASSFDLSGEQREAVAAAVFGSVVVVTGGPGTGKTTIVVAMLEALLALGVDMERVALAAPTGKATHRLSESVGKRMRGEPPRTETLHRLLGARPGEAGFAHGLDNPLPLDVLVVDEASMLDLSLATHLVEALGPRTRLILLGDVDQLPSVNAGAVLEQLVLGLPPAQVVRLTTSYRMRMEDPAGRMVYLSARACHEGEPERLLELASDPSDAVHFTPVSDGQSLRRLVAAAVGSSTLGRPNYRTAVRRRFRLDEGRFHEDERPMLERILKAIASTQVLTLTRREGFAHGAERVGELMHQRYAALMGAPETHALLPGEPVMMLRNDYERRLFNGDVGVVLDGLDTRGRARRLAVFPTAAGPLGFELEPLLGDLEPAHAVTVHKAQGSEYDRIWIVLPENDIELATRQMLYTAVTRARKGVHIAGPPSVLRAALARKEIRSSALAERLRRQLEVVP